MYFLKHLQLEPNDLKLKATEQGHQLTEVEVVSQHVNYSSSNTWLSLFVSVSLIQQHHQVAVISDCTLTREPVHDGTFVCLSLGRQEHSKLHFTFQLSAAKNKYTFYISRQSLAHI